METPMYTLNGKGPNCNGNENNTTEKEPMMPPKQPRRLTEIYESMPLTDDTTCGAGCCKSPFLQRFANKNAFVVIYSITGAVYGATYSYFNGTLTTIEKRFKIPSRTSGLITVGNDISSMLLNLFITYYASRGHIPRWVAFGLYTVVAFCMLNAVPHFLYGAGEDALKLTAEYTDTQDSMFSSHSHNMQADTKGLCEGNSSCDENSGSLVPPIILFVAQLIAGIGGALYYTLGIVYIDDNVKKDKSPMLVSFSFFIRMLGPATGYGLSSVCLKMYISPSLTPTITPKDPRWLGAWWLGWLVLGVLLLFFSSFLFLFPKTLPKTVARKILAEEIKNLEVGCEQKKSPNEEIPTSFQDMILTLKRLISNKVLMCSTFCSLFFCFGYAPYWFFMAKYMETIFKKTAYEASFLTGYVGIVFSAFGLLLSGCIITKLKPSARYMAGWNVFVSVFSILAVFSYIFIGCQESESQMSILANGKLELSLDCNQDCNCDMVSYTPVCAPDGQTYISPCHTGCHDVLKLKNGTKVYTNCSCVDYQKLTTLVNVTSPEDHPWYVLNGPCPVDCSKSFLIFLIILSSVKFMISTSRLSNVLISMRCVEERDKAVSIGLIGTILSMFAFIPAPIVFGYIIDQACVVWGKTCTGTGNCWLYNPKALRYLMNGTAFVFLLFGLVFEVGVWYYAKDLKIFDNEEIKDKHIGTETKKNKINKAKCLESIES